MIFTAVSTNTYIYNVPNPVTYAPTTENLTADFAALDGQIARQRRVSVPQTYRRRIAMQWDGLDVLQAGQLEAVWNWLRQQTPVTMVAPNGQTLAVYLDPKDRAFGREPYSTGVGAEIVYAVSLVVYGLEV